MKKTLCIIAFLVMFSIASVAAASNGGEDHRTTICHKTGSESNPWVLIRPDNASLPAHFAHGDVLPRDGNCPTTAAGWPLDDGGSL